MEERFDKKFAPAAGMPWSMDNIKAFITQELADQKAGVQIWCDCGDLMEPSADDKFQGVYGKAVYCLGCDKIVYIASEKSKKAVATALKKKL